MSQYPRPPSFHGPFNPNSNPNANATPPLATAPNGMSQFPYHQYANTYPYSATGPSMNAALPVAGLNTTPFGVNGRMANGPFTQTPYPQTQTPYGMLPQTSPVALPREANLGSMQPHNSLPQKPPPVAAMTDIFPHTYRSFNRPFVTNISEPEDGELSEGGFGKKGREPLAPTQKPSYESPNSESGEKLDQSAGNARNAAENGNQQLQKSQPPKASNSAYNTSSEVNDANIALRESHENRRGSQSPVASKISTNQALASKPSLEDNTNRTAVGFSRDSSPQEDIAGIAKWQRLRDSAKDALKDFHDRGLGFSQLVNAGIDSEILCELYSELNILVPSTQLLGSTQAVVVNNVGSGSERIDHPRETNNTTQADIINDKLLERLRKDGKKDQIPKDSSNGLESKISDNPSSLETKSYVNGSEANGSNTRESDARATKNPNPVSKPIQFVKPNKSTATNLLVKSITAKPGDKGLEERKDYIARMLAAKSGKPISVASTALSPQNPADLERTSQPASKVQRTRPAASADGQCLDVGDVPTTTTVGDLKTMETVSINHPIGINAAYGQVMLSSGSEAQRAMTEPSGTSLHEQRVSVPHALSFDSAKHTNKAVIYTEGGQSSENIPNSTGKNEIDAEAKKRAKTELARQKIEELKNRGNIAQPSNRINPKGLIPSLEPVEESQLRLSQELTSTSPFTPISQATPASSTFTALSRKSTVTIPGLFMESMPPEPVLITDQPELSVDNTEAPATPYIIPISDPPGSGVKRSEEESERSPIQSSFGANSTSLNLVNQVQPVATAEPRRRQKAADYIDSAPIKARRPLGHNNDTIVIIEVSDNEEMGDTENENIDIDEDIAMDIDEDNFQSSPTKQPNSIESVPGKQKVMRDLPPLSDFPPRKKISLNAVVTPPVVQTPAKIKDPESYKTKVKEIEQMNRRIAELEQRIKAKQTASRAETPGTPRRSASPKLPEVSAESQKKPRPEASHVIVNKGDEQIEVRNLKDVTEATSLPEKTSTVEATDAYVPSEIPEVAEALQITEQERELREQHTQNMERTEAETERLQEAPEAMAIEQERIVSEARAKDIEQAKVDAERIRVTEAAEAADKKRKLRLCEIDSGIPVLDAEVEKSKQELSSLEQKVEVLKSQVRKAEEWKRILLEERSELSPPEPSGANPEPTGFMSTANQDHLQTEETTAAINGVGAPMTALCIDSVEFQQTQHMAYNDKQIAPNSPAQYSSPSSSSSPPSGNAQVQHELVDDQADLMDTSPDNSNGNGVADYSPEVPPVIPEGSVDAEEVYEPPEIPISNPQAPIRSSRTADSSDSDDYEPPESLSPVEHSMISPVDVSTNPVPAASHSAASIGTTSQPVSANLTSDTKDQQSTLSDSVSADVKPGPAVISNTRVKKFIPYESPLKQFKSFRYHPDYLAEVPHGFRSMTYIHNIDPERPVCRYELAGGVCNDDSCDGQHFRNMSLSDETVLLQMGAVPPSLIAQEAQAYRDGLRQVIQKIRERKVKDCSAVASEIAAYRTKFLGDNHKILPL